MQLILDSYGTRLSVQNGLFAVRLEEQVKQVLPEKLKSIFVSKGISVTTDALLLALQHDIDVVLLDSVGMPKGRLWSGKFGSITTIRHKQSAFAKHAKGMIWAKERVQIKVAEQLAFAHQLRYSPEVAQPEKLDKAIQQIQHIHDKLAEIPYTFEPPATFPATLRGWEGTAAKNYFQIIGKALPDFYRFELRNRRPAKDIFNCLLNYLYGILYAHVESALLKAGLDPSIGIWHTDEYNKPVLVYDTPNTKRRNALSTKSWIATQRRILIQVFDAFRRNALSTKSWIATFNKIQNSIITELCRNALSTKSWIATFYARFHVIFPFSRNALSTKSWIATEVCHQKAPQFSNAEMLYPRKVGLRPMPNR